MNADEPPSLLLATKTVMRQCKKLGITKKHLIKAVDDYREKGCGNELAGRSLIKVRIPRPGQGKRGGYRGVFGEAVGSGFTIYLFAFAKSEMDNLSKASIRELRRTVEIYSGLPETIIEQMIKDGDLVKLRG